MELKENQLSLVKRYPLETLVAFMLCGMLFLATLVYNLNTKVDNTNERLNSYLLNDRQKMIEVIQANTQAIENIRR